MTEPCETFEEYSARLLRGIADSHGISYAELTADWPPPALATFYMIVRWEGRDDLREIEREITAALKITDFDDFGVGLAFNRIEDAQAVAAAMGRRLDRLFAVAGEDGVAIAPVAEVTR